MISAGATLRIERIGLRSLTVNEFQVRYPERLTHYIQLLQARPDDYPGIISVVPSDMHPGAYVLLDGHHRYVAAIMCGKPDLLCIVIEEPA